MLTVPHAEVQTLRAPSLFYTVHGAHTQNPGSVRVIEHMTRILAAKDAPEYLQGISCRTFSTMEEAAEVPSHAVMVVDGNCRNYFSFGAGSGRAQWSVIVGAKCFRATHRFEGCARNTLGVFGRRFRTQIEQGHYPWGPPKKKSQGPRDMVILNSADINTTLQALNAGPDLARAVAAKDFAAALPEGSRISWLRIPPAPLQFSEAGMRTVAHAMRSFEEACGVLIKESAEVRRQILAGVTIPDERLHDVYASPNVPYFSVARPDIHWNEENVNVSENDEMPGGMPELAHLDASYGVNEARWHTFLKWLTAEGPLLFVVSHEWSKVYIPETEWLVRYFQSKGYPVHLLTTDKLHELSVDERGVYFQGQKVGTLWRQFPIFETEGVLAELVLAAHRRAVRMLPEFAHFGNKTWFHVFWERKEWFRAHLEADTFDLLLRILPESRFVESASSFPLVLNGFTVETAAALAALSQAQRDRMVLKICGANNLAARSYGVLMGEGISVDKWADWVRERLANKEPFLIQKRFETGVVRMPVYNTGTGQAEMFLCRLLMRPWIYGSGEIVSVHGCAVPERYFKVHGMVDMAVAPVVLS